MNQQTLHQNFVYARARSLCESTIEQKLMNDVRIIGVLIQILYNIQKINIEAS